MRYAEIALRYFTAFDLVVGPVAGVVLLYFAARFFRNPIRK
jgi:hypothetical protein